MKILFNKEQTKNHWPTSHITLFFFGYNFFVNESTLIPRIDSEIIIEDAISFFLNDKQINEKLKNKKTIKILDACCGSGCFGLSFVKNIAKKQTITNQQNVAIELTMLDISSAAIQVAKINAQKLLPNTQSINVKYIINNVIINGFGYEKYDIILYNPPYIEKSTIAHLDESVKNFEPHLALDGGEDGLKFYKTVAPVLIKNFFQNSIAFCEIGFNQGERTKKIFSENGFTVEIKKDYGHRDRYLILKNKNY